MKRLRLIWIKLRYRREARSIGAPMPGGRELKK